MRSMKLLPVPDDVWCMIFRDASHCQAEELNVIVSKIHEPLRDVLEYCGEASYPMDYPSWLSAVQTRARIVLVCRNWNRLGTPILYSSYFFKLGQFSNNEKFIAVCSKNSGHLANYIQVLDTPEPYNASHEEVALIEAFLPLCIKLKRFRFHSFFSQESLFSLIPRTIQEISLTVSLEQCKIFAETSTEFLCLETLELTLLGHIGGRDPSSPITKIYLPTTRTFTFQRDSVQPVFWSMPLSFSCPRLENLILQDYSDEQLITNSLELQHIWIDYTSMLMIEKKNPNTLLHSRLQQVYLLLPNGVSFDDIGILAAAQNMHSLFLYGEDWKGFVEVDSLLTFLSDKSSAPKLISVYFIQSRCGAKIDTLENLFLNLLPALQERGVSLFIRKWPKYVKIQSRDEILDIFHEGEDDDDDDEDEDEEY